jgi:glycosyltransferase involved in cell wall biosynthesis
VKKKKLLYQSDFSLAKTGFGRASKALLKYLYNTSKYEIIHYCCGLTYNHPELSRTPWKSLGTLPNSRSDLEELNKDPSNFRMASYGAHLIDKVINEIKPDVYIAAQDIWGIDFAIEKKWFNQITTALWTTLDSLPILPSAVEKADKIKNYWIWSDFAAKNLHRLGHAHVETIHGPIETDKFFKLTQNEKKALRSRHNIDQESFIIGFVFRNQLRKSVPNLLEGYALWKRSNPKIKNTFLFLHTSWKEGWNIPKLTKEYELDPREILTTYTCGQCGKYEVKQFVGEDVSCPYCRCEKCQSTTSVSLGVTEEQLNEIYNLMDVYCHPFTSGGQEIPIQEAKLTELITLVTNYSCGEEMCCEEACSLPLEWSEYREHGTEFIKASTKPNSIAKQLNKVYLMPKHKREELGKKAREWTIKNYSVEVIGEKIEKFIDSAPFLKSDFTLEELQKDPYFQIPDIKDDTEWLIYMYTNILKRPEVNEQDDGHKYWMEEIKKGTPRIAIENYFRKVALQENQKDGNIDFNKILNDQIDPSKRILFVMPENEEDIFLSTSLLESIKNNYPDHYLYFATKPEFFSILEGNPFIHKVIQYFSQMDNPLWLEGYGPHKGYFDLAFIPHLSSQRAILYTHNGKDKLAFNIKDF